MEQSETKIYPTSQFNQAEGSFDQRVTETEDSSCGPEWKSGVMMGTQVGVCLKQNTLCGMLFKGKRVSSWGKSQINYKFRQSFLGGTHCVSIIQTKHDGSHCGKNKKKKKEQGFPRFFETRGKGWRKCPQGFKFYTWMEQKDENQKVVTDDPTLNKKTHITLSWLYFSFYKNFSQDPSTSLKCRLLTSPPVFEAYHAAL